MNLDNPLASGLGRPLRQGLITRALRSLLPDLAIGQLRLELPDGLSIASNQGAPGPDVTLEIRRWRALATLGLGGEIGFARAHIDGDWSTSDLTNLFELVMLNEACLSSRISPTWFARALHRLRHRRNRNTRSGSRRNIVAHYDLGNSFYEAWLDRGMNYSSALYRGPSVSLESAQNAKLERVLELLAPLPGQQILEIGCGWGSLAERLVRDHQCSITAVTLSHAQLAYARRRMADLIVTGRADIRLQDYRAITGCFDRIVSIEMIEAVGEDYWPTFFATLRDRLRMRGVAVLQAITIAETRFEDYRIRPDFIQRYIFPGGMLPTVSLIRKHAEQAGLGLIAYEAFGDSYARTLAEWRQRFNQAWPQLARAGFDQRFRRLWDYYLAYCEVGFRFKATDVAFFKFLRK